MIAISVVVRCGDDDDDDDREERRTGLFSSAHAAEPSVFDCRHDE